MDEGSEVRWVGRAVGQEGERLLLRASLRIEDEVVELREGRTLVLDVEGRGEVRIELGDAEFVDSEPVEGPWSHVASDPRATAFRDRAPGDHVRCRLEGLVIVPGTRVAIEGSVEVAEIEGESGYRAAPVARPRAIRAHVVAAGPDAEERLEAHLHARERKRKPAGAPEPRERAPRPLPIPRPYARAPIVLGALGAIGGLFSIDLLFVRRALEGRSLGTLVLAASCLAASLALLRLLRRAFFAPFSPATGNPYGRRPPWSGGAIDATLAVLVLLGPGALFFLGETHALSRILFLGLAVVGLVQAGVVLHGDRPFLRSAWLLLRARSLGSMLVDGAWGTLDARVPGDPAAVVFDRRTVFTHRSEHREHTTQDAQGRTVTTMRTESFVASAVVGRAEHELEVEAADRRVRIDLGRAAVHVVGRSYLPDAHREVAAVLGERIRGGDSMRILGRVRVEGSGVVFRSTGAESLFVFAVPASMDVGRALLLRVLAAGTRFLLPLLASGVALFCALHDPLFVHRRGEVVFEQGAFAGVNAPARCELELSTFVDRVGSGRCRARVTCGSTVLYGEGSLGFFDCDVTGSRASPRIVGADPATDDGDPAFSFSSHPPRVLLGSATGESLVGRFGALVPTL